MTLTLSYFSSVLILLFFLARAASEATHECGVPDPKVSHSLRIHNGHSFTHGTWPWLVALLLRTQTPNKFFCTGVLVTENKVLTAAHCIRSKFTTNSKKPEEISMVFGVHDLNEMHHPGTQISAPSTVLVHKDYNPNTENYDADIAMLIITQYEVMFTRFIKPICIWSQKLDPSVEKGFIAGWGENQEKKYESEPKQLEIPIKQNADCFLDNYLLAVISSNRTFCGGSKDGSGPCLGDSGTGLYIKVNGVYYLRGLVSSTLLNDDSNCDTMNFAIYTDVLKFTSWIDGSKDKTSQLNEANSKIEKEKLRQENCGIMKGKLDASEVEDSIFPWTVSVVRSDEKKGNLLLYTGTLISSRHVVLQVSNFLEMAYSLSKLRLFFGPATPTTLGIAVSLITSYPDFKKKGNFEIIPDIAVLLSAKAIEFTDEIFPVCLPTNTENSDIVEGKLGYTVGLNMEDVDDNSLTYSKNFVPLKVASVKHCSSIYGEFFFNSSSSTFYCAKPEVRTAKPFQLNDPFYIEIEGRWNIVGFLYSCRNTTVRSCSGQKALMFDNISTLSSLIRADLPPVNY